MIPDIEDRYDERDDGTVYHHVALRGATPIGLQKVPKLTLLIQEPMLDLPTLADARLFHRRQAEVLASALLNSLPGGTVDALLAELMFRKASLYSVTL